VGSACASRFFLNSPFRRCVERSSLRIFATAAVVVASRTAPFPEGRSSAAKFLSDSAFRVAPSGISGAPAEIKGILWITSTAFGARFGNRSIVSPPRDADGRA